MVQLVFLLAGYLSYAPLGVFFGLEKHLPLLLGGNKADEAREVERTGVTATYALSALAAIAMCVYAVVARSAEPMMRIAVVFGALYLVFAQVSSAYRVVLRSHLQFGVVARSTVYEGMLLLALVVAGSYVLDAAGTMAGWALGVAIVCLYLLSAAKLPGLVRLDLHSGTRLVRIGLPVLGASLTSIFVRTADNLVVVKCLGLEALGYYGLAWQLASYLYNAAGAADAVLTPRIFQDHGRGGEDEVRGFVLRATSVLGILMPVLSGAAAIVAPLLIRLILPRYVPAIPPFQVFCYTVVFMALPMAVRTIMVAANREFELMALDGLSGLLIAGSVWFLIHRDPHVPLAHIALAGGVGLFVSAYSVITRALMVLRVRPRRLIPYMVSLAVPLAYSVGCLFGARRAAGFLFPGAPSAVSELVALVVFLVATLPLVWWAERRTGVITSFRNRHSLPPA
jgi:lipopolysaccharide exporter